MLYKLKCCGKCNGDLTLGGDEWRCLQCGKYYYPRFSLVGLSEDSLRVLQNIDYKPNMVIAGIRSTLEDPVLVR